MLTKQITTRGYEAGDEDAIIDLLNQSFPEWRARDNAMDHWVWKYLDTPLGALVNVALSEGKIIGDTLGRGGQFSPVKRKAE